jgi:hypothetical protein
MTIKVYMMYILCKKLAGIVNMEETPSTFLSCPEKTDCKSLEKPVSRSRQNGIANVLRFTTLLLFASLLPSQTMGQRYEESWQTVRTFKTSPATTVTINNKYGNVKVHTWNNDSVRIEVSGRIADNNQERLKRARSNVDIQIGRNATGIHAETFFGSRHTTFIQGVREVANFSTESRSKIDYNIYLPINSNLHIINKYGDIVLPTLSGKVTVDLSNGNIQGRDLSDNANLILAFGNARFRNMGNAEISLNFVDLRVEKTGNLDLTSRSSTIQIKTAGTIKLDSRRDKLTFDEVQSIEGSTYFSYLDCALVHETFQLTAQFGEITRVALSQGFKECILDARACNTNIKLVSPDSYTALIRATKGKIDLPAALLPTVPGSHHNIDKEPVSFYHRAKNSSTKLKLNILDGDLKIIHL